MSTRGYALMDLAGSTPSVLTTAASPMGELSAEDNLLLTPTTAGQFVPVVAATLQQRVQHAFDSPAPGRLRYLGETTLFFSAGGALSFTGANNHNIQFRLRANGAVFVPGALIETRMSGVGDIASSAVRAMVALAPNDYIEWVVSDSGGADVLVKHFNLYIFSMLSVAG